MMLRRLLNGDLAHFVVVAAYKDGVPIGPLVRNHYLKHSSEIVSQRIKSL